MAVFDIDDIVQPLQTVRQQWREVQKRYLEPGGRELPAREALGDIVGALKAALADISERLTRDPGGIRDEDLQGLRLIGFTQQAVTEVLEISAFFNYANRLTIALDVVPDEQFFAGRDPSSA
jgi:alkylhydroperoxidase family enzyme